ncbi:hypothetical protein BJ980_001683 [Nocardioides daedukensis]|uniref:Tox-REase-7 domain-containing protein n=1 Tax=Nocardioides daedukensis TaxID=634462 RepID=A0A7Y9S3G5_9ACTN|nr:hypothetical protein [Nocardioides daedukensis]NYG58760.1 hypothetical protein [Nocardioides daedukensis]
MLIAVLIALLWVPAAGALADVPAQPPSVHVYNGHHHTDAPTYTASERGPPSTYDSSTAYDPDGLGPFGASARPNVAIGPATYGYDDLARFAQSARGSSGVEEQVDSTVAVLVVAQRSGVAANAGTRLAQDVAVSPIAPNALGLGRSIGRASHNQALQADIAALPRGATGIRVNQQQVNALGQRVGINRPDLQYSLNGQRYYVEYEGLANPRGALHEARILANDPGSNFILRLVP